MVGNTEVNTTKIKVMKELDKARLDYYNGKCKYEELRDVFFFKANCDELIGYLRIPIHSDYNITKALKKEFIKGNPEYILKRPKKNNDHPNLFKTIGLILSWVVYYFITSSERTDYQYAKYRGVEVLDSKRSGGKISYKLGGKLEGKEPKRNFITWREYRDRHNF